MFFRHLLLVFLLALIGLVNSQRLRRPLGGRTDETEEISEPVRARSPLLRNRQRALQGEEGAGELGGNSRFRPLAGRARRPGGRRPGAGRPGRRFPGRPGRRPRPIYYDYYDYYEDYEPEYYYDYDDYYEDEKLPTPTRPQSTSDDAEKKKSVFAEAGDSETDILLALWDKFMKERGTTEAPVEYECPPNDDVSYYLPDEEQCDKYLECNIKGELRQHLCPDGFVFDIHQEKCDYPVKVNCTGRDLLQEPQPSVNCSRANGFFAWPANISCQNFWDCREGIAYQQTCPVGVIFDPGLNTCATPDQSSRKECTEGKESFLGFQCPDYTPGSLLRFGNHDRLPHPDDCQSYFTCLLTGGPRLANCGRKKVFNNATGQCSNPKDVPGCETYWIEKLAEEGDDEYYYDDY